MLWAVVNELLIQPREYSAFSLSLERLRDDPRIAVTLGTPVSGYGQVCCLSEPRYGASVPPRLSAYALDLMCIAVCGYGQACLRQ